MNATIKTIRRGTKQFERALDSATGIRSYSLGDGFVGKNMDEDNPALICSPREWLRRELERFRFAKLQHMGASRYTLHVHSNLWYEFDALV